MSEDKKQGGNFTKREDRPGNVVELQPKETPPAPQIVGQITITLLDDGNFSCDAPWQDRILVHGLIGMFLDVERDMAVQMKARRMSAAPATKEPFWKRKSRELAAKFGAVGKQIVDDSGMRSETPKK